MQRVSAGLSIVTKVLFASSVLGALPGPAKQTYFLTFLCPDGSVTINTLYMKVCRETKTVFGASGT